MKTSKKIKLILAIVSLSLFLTIAFNISSFSQIDSFFNAISSSIQNSAIIQTSEVISLIFDPINVIIFSLFTALLIWARGAKKDAFLFAILIAAGGITIFSVKEIIQRARPLNALITESSFSFPSGHALITLIFLGFFIYLAIKNIKSKTKKSVISIILIILILIVGVSRIILNVHWASDILAGWLMGLTLLLAGISKKTN